QMTEAIKFVLKQHNFKAGKYKVGYQSCDDATAQAGKWASEKCSANANAYAQNKSVVGVIGTFNSGCAEIVIPVLNRAAGGPVGMVSPANTYVGLTHGGPGTAAGEPDKYYPTGKRNYIRIVAAVAGPQRAAARTGRVRPDRRRGQRGGPVGGGHVRQRRRPAEREPGGGREGVRQGLRRHAEGRQRRSVLVVRGAGGRGAADRDR